MIIHTENLEQVKAICSHFSIPYKPRLIRGISFPYAFELKTIDGEKVPDTEYTFEEFKRKFTYQGSV